MMVIGIVLFVNRFKKTLVNPTTEIQAPIGKLQGFLSMNGVNCSNWW